MKRIRSITRIVLMCSVFIMGEALAQPRATQVGDRLAAFEMEWREVKPEALSARARAAAEVLVDSDLKQPATIVPLKSSDGVSRRTQITVPDSPALDIVYLHEYDELRLVNTELATSTAPINEISQEEAINLARRAFDGLAKHKLIDPRHFNWDRVDVASTWAGGSSRDAKTIDKRRVEYRITLRRELNGVELANAGLRIAVHTSGRLAALRLGGVSVKLKINPNGVEEPVGKGRWLERKVTAEELKARFEREGLVKNAKLKVAWSSVLYVMPESKRVALVEPLYVVSYSLEVPSDDGTTAVSRRKTVGFSLTDAKAPSVDLTPPVRAPQLEKIRKE